MATSCAVALCVLFLFTVFAFSETPQVFITIVTQGFLSDGVKVAVPPGSEVFLHFKGNEANKFWYCSSGPNNNDRGLILEGNEQVIKVNAPASGQEKELDLRYNRKIYYLEPCVRYDVHRTLILKSVDPSVWKTEVIARPGEETFPHLYNRTLRVFPRKQGKQGQLCDWEIVTNQARNVVYTELQRLTEPTKYADVYTDVTPNEYRNRAEGVLVLECKKDGIVVKTSTLKLDVVFGVATRPTIDYDTLPGVPLDQYLMPVKPGTKQPVNPRLDPH